MSEANIRTGAVSYTLLAKWLHWIMAFLLFGTIIYGWTFDDLKGQELSQALSYHAFVGFLIAALCVLRYSWRIYNPPPQLPMTLSRPQIIAATVIHNTLYVLMIVVPLTGLLTVVAHEVPVVVFGLLDLQHTFSFIGVDNFDFKRNLHEQSVHILEALIIGHIGAALVHQFWFEL